MMDNRAEGSCAARVVPRGARAPKAAPTTKAPTLRLFSLPYRKSWGSNSIPVRNRWTSSSSTMQKKYPLKTNLWDRLESVRRAVMVACLTVAVLAASEHHGQVTFGTLPVPGATVTITQGDKKFVAITDPKGAYAFPDLPDGTWNVRVEMLCFSTINSDVVI